MHQTRGHTKTLATEARRLLLLHTHGDGARMFTFSSQQRLSQYYVVSRFSFYSIDGVCVYNEYVCCSQASPPLVNCDSFVFW